MQVTGSDHRARRAAYLVLGVAVLARIALGSFEPLAPDETYYWEWSRRLAAGYVDHPSAIALLVRLGTLALGATPLGVRIGSLVAGGAASLVIVRVSGSLGGDRAMLRAAWIIACLPLAQVGLALATPDAPLLLFWSLALAALLAAVRIDTSRRARDIAWTLAGVALGAAMYSKYTAILLLLGVGVAVVAQPSLRRELATRGPYAALAAAIIVFAPNLIWNAKHGWLSFAIQLEHGLGVHRGFALAHEANLLGGQIALVSPLLLAAFAIVVGRAMLRPDDAARTTLAIIGAVTWLAFAASALRSAVEPNWQAPAYLSAIVLAATFESGNRWRKFLRTGVALGGAITLIIYAQALFAILPLSASLDPTAAGAGWSTLAAHVDSARAGAPRGAAAWVAGERYQEASELAFHLADHPTTFVIDVHARRTQYDLWPDFPQRAHAGDRLVLVLGMFSAPDDDPVIAALTSHFDRVTLREVVALRRGASVRTWRRVWVLDGWHDSWPAAQLAR
ncbi:MAG TPA: glycosyltransferase family 39 protein [Gemmatimonadaceae bacterium]|nr:glycosyltransferase family 39 protein [Gemmatimonadaceae bacterium]